MAEETHGAAAASASRAGAAGSDALLAVENVTAGYLGDIDVLRNV